MLEAALGSESQGGRQGPRIFHIAPEAAWEAAKAGGKYEADTLASEGFIHCATSGQVIAVANRFYQGREGLILLAIETARIGAEVRYENLEGGSERFPHVYGPIETEAVIATCPLPPGPGGRFTAPAGFLA